jgi:hypothetical protein
MARQNAQVRVPESARLPVETSDSFRNGADCVAETFRIFPLKRLQRMREPVI